MVNNDPLQPLSVLLAGVWPQAAPQTLAELQAEPFAELKARLRDAGVDEPGVQTVLALRRHSVDALRADSKITLSRPDLVRDLLTRKLVTTRADHWAVYPLNADRTRVLVPHAGGGMHYLVHFSRRLPTAKELADKAPLPKDGTYLLIWGGSAEVLAVAGVADALAGLRSTVPVADVVCWHLEAARPPAFYSVAVGCGVRDDMSSGAPRPRRLPLPEQFLAHAQGA